MSELGRGHLAEEQGQSASKIKQKPEMFLEKVNGLKVWKPFFVNQHRGVFSIRESINPLLVGSLFLSTPMFWKVPDPETYSWLATLEFPAAFTFVRFVKALILLKPFVLLKRQLSSPYWKGSSGFVSCAHGKQLGSMEKPLTMTWKECGHGVPPFVAEEVKKKCKF